MIRFRSPIYWEPRMPKMIVSILCYQCGTRYETTYKKIESKRNNCPNCMYKVVD